jgi:hypothetical protein
VLARVLGYFAVYASSEKYGELALIESMGYGGFYTIILP